MRRSVQWSALMAVLIGTGCGDPGPDDWPAGRPRIDGLVFLDQKPQAPLDLLFQVDFVDTDGDLGGGRVELMIDDAPGSTLALADVFDAQFPPLTQTATAGSFEIYVRLGDEVGSGDRVRVELVLEDAAGRRSNRPSVTLEAAARLGENGGGNGT